MLKPSMSDGTSPPPFGMRNISSEGLQAGDAWEEMVSKTNSGAHASWPIAAQLSASMDDLAASEGAERGQAKGGGGGGGHLARRRPSSLQPIIEEADSQGPLLQALSASGAEPRSLSLKGGEVGGADDERPHRTQQQQQHHRIDPSAFPWMRIDDPDTLVGAIMTSPDELLSTVHKAAADDDVESFPPHRSRFINFNSTIGRKFWMHQSLIRHTGVTRVLVHSFATTFKDSNRRKDDDGATNAAVDSVLVAMAKALLHVSQFIENVVVMFEGNCPLDFVF
ncbi:hypothetical protein CBR_g48202 [Chara braunii]|uniref:Uncharacterized protein n=1 Tax=Chara braunii TaxID=69332 RepID=A0A388M289_CHABU|nr:hypothetical protein CBR_g48202 [Chara braunii]|eukprot:GBG88671.1 hypothetical protein CBR_g48202 [Chara braunii]